MRGKARLNYIKPENIEYTPRFVRESRHICKTLFYYLKSGS